VPQSDQAKPELARETTRRALDQTRNLSAELKRLQEELASELGAPAESYVHEEVEVAISFSGDDQAVPKPVGTQVYVATSEASRNTVSHSGYSRIGIPSKSATGVSTG
jgi:hypothetical protein